ncbi:MAG: sigma-70 family RNA polymerase sigma factor, partial [Omnitrophica bacterium]|nr:sigma-70 family RNA polymerase sigma factor [Candidatus Omnitrophota bacterium]
MFSWLPNKKLKREFEEKAIEHIDSLYNLAWQMTRNRQDAEDLVQEASLRAYRNFSKFKPGTNFKAWIITILRNIYINQYRKKIKEPQRVEFDKVESFVSLPEVTAVQEEIFSETIQSSIAELPEELRTTLTLFYAEEFSYKEIAGIIDVPVGTVMSRLHRA